MKFLLDDMMLTVGTPTTAGSRMLEGYMSLFAATAAQKLTEKGHTFAGKVGVGEFAIDLVGETAYQGAAVENGKLTLPAASALAKGEADVAVCLDVNGAPRRAAAQSGLVFIKPTYGIVSRYGVIPVACSGEAVGVMAKTADDAKTVLADMAGKDMGDGTMHADDICKKAANGCEKTIRKVAVPDMEAGADVKAAMDAAMADMAADGIEIVKISADVIATANIAWNMLMCAELCNNVSRYDGIKFGYRSRNYKTLDELYTNSRTEAFGSLLKTAILFGSDVLSSKNYDAKYDKGLRVRRVIVEAFAKIFADADAVLLPATSKMAYAEGTDATLVFEENRYTAPASITGLPAVVAGGVQLIGPAFSDGALLSLAKILTKEGK